MNWFCVVYMYTMYVQIGKAMYIGMTRNLRGAVETHKERLGSELVAAMQFIAEVVAKKKVEKADGGDAGEEQSEPREFRSSAELKEVWQMWVQEHAETKNEVPEVRTLIGEEEKVARCIPVMSMTRYIGCGQNLMEWN